MRNVTEFAAQGKTVLGSGPASLDYNPCYPHLFIRVQCRPIPRMVSTRSRPYLGGYTMSRIWDSLQDIEKRLNHQISRATVKEERPFPDRRSTDRQRINIPVLVYGYGVGNVPFHEETEGLHVNARGGLITLTTPVAPGETLLLINEVNQKEQKCNVLGRKSTIRDRNTVVIEFPEPVDFWGTSRD